MELPICQQIFAIWGLVNFLLFFLSDSKSSFFLLWQKIAALHIALTDDGVHAAAMLSSAYRAGAECPLSQADAAWVRNVIADSENFLPDLLREVP